MFEESLYLPSPIKLSMLVFLGMSLGRYKDFFMSNELDLLSNKVNNSEITIDSREIAELTGKLHLHILRDIDKMDEYLGGISKFGDTYIHPQNNQTYRYYQLPKRETLILVSGYSVELRAKIIDRLEYLENQLKPTLPTHIEALRLYADQLETNQLLIQQQEIDKPKVQFYETVTQQGNWLTAKELSNILAFPELGRNNLLKKLRDMKYLTQYNKPYQKFIDQKLIRLAEDKKGRTFPLFSQKFLDRIIKEIK